ncbi:unnamed protein product [Bursaphelenchus okinawaensis]|uniref:Uncharacterized protein n=1 Tax=Bursaphelenchus okinawaensis TaxID=465554 RepID=A0A811K1X6_9BILA|nr:unnamed protein product [Bursaphelenchus okinawaensis]CAG9089039.1 unnamed protein product [Bursaphelenchus okinawaensis]
MQFDASFLQKIVAANVLNERGGQVICSKFLSFQHIPKNSTVIRSSTHVCPHYVKGPNVTKFTYDKFDVTDLNYVFSLKDIDNLYAYQNVKGAFIVFNFNRHKPFYVPYSKETKHWMVGSVVLQQGKDERVGFYEGRYLKSINNGNVDLFHEKVIGSTKAGNLWFRNGTCKKFEAKEGNLVGYNCLNPSELLLSLKALKECGATLSDDEASAHDFAILYYEQAPTTTTSTTLATTTEMVTDPDDVFTTSSAQLETPTTTGNVSTDTNDTGLSLLATIAIVVGVVFGLALAISIFIYWKYYLKEKKNEETDITSSKPATSPGNAANDKSSANSPSGNNHGSDGERVC